MKSLCFWDVRATKLLLGATSLIMPTCPFVPNQITQKLLNAVSRHTHSMTWNINRHRLRQELKRALRRWHSRTVSGGCLSADVGRDCTISTPAMNDTRIKVEYVHVEKESDHGAISIRDRRPLQSKTKTKATCTSNSIVCGFHRERPTTQYSNMLTW